MVPYIQPMIILCWERIMALMAGSFIILESIPDMPFPKGPEGAPAASSFDSAGIDGFDVPAGVSADLVCAERAAARKLERSATWSCKRDCCSAKLFACFS